MVGSAGAGDFGDDRPAFDIGVAEREMTLDREAAVAGAAAEGRPACERATLNLDTLCFVDNGGRDRCFSVEPVEPVVNDGDTLEAVALWLSEGAGGTVWRYSPSGPTL